jgi:hypothetical protein
MTLVPGANLLLNIAGIVGINIDKIGPSTGKLKLAAPQA